MDGSAGEESPAVQETWGTRVQSLGQEDTLEEENGNPLQYSCLKNPMGRGAWWAAVSGVAQSRTRLKQLSSSSSGSSKEPELTEDTS